MLRKIKFFYTILELNYKKICNIFENFKEVFVRITGNLFDNCRKIWRECRQIIKENFTQISDEMEGIF